MAALIVANEKVVDDAVRLRHTCCESNDLQTQDLMIKRLEYHEKTLWMLKSYLR